MMNGVVTRGSCIDNILTNSEHVILAKTLNLNFSDHFAVAIKRKRVRVRHEKITFKGRSYRNYVKEDMQSRLLVFDWTAYFQMENPNDCWNVIENLVRGYLDENCPEKLFKVRQANEPWINNEIIEQIKDKDRALRTARWTGKKDDWAFAKRERNRVGRLVEQAKAELLRDQQTKLVDDPKICWRVVKSVVPGKKTTSHKISLIDKSAEEGDRDVAGPATADFINTFFTNIGPKLAQNHNKPWFFYGDVVQDDCPRFTTNYAQVLKLCRDINPLRARAA